MNSFRYLPFVQRALQHAGPPLHLTLFVTGACNLRCRHCFHFAEVARSVPGPSAENVERLAESTGRMGPLLWVSFGGGEPFLRRDLPRLAHSFGSRGLRHLAIPTNGLVDRMHASIEQILAENLELYLSVAVSFDGPPAVHDSIRQLPGAHARSVEAVHALKRQARELAERGGSRLGIGIITTVTSENQDSLAEHGAQLVRELQPDNWTINLARGTALDESLLSVDPARYREVVEAKRRLLREGGLPYFDFPLARLAVARDDLMYEHVEAQARTPGERWLPCTAGKLSAVIFEDGSVRPCEILGDELGNLNEVDWDLSRLWENARAARLRDTIRETRCACTWECAQADNVLFRARSWPQLALRALRR